MEEVMEETFLGRSIILIDVLYCRVRFIRHISLAERNAKKICTLIFIKRRVNYFQNCWIFNFPFSFFIYEVILITKITFASSIGQFINNTCFLYCQLLQNNSLD